VTATYHIGNRSSMPITISNNSYLVCLTGTRLVVAAFCQPVETYKRAATERRRRTATFVYSSLRAPSSLFPRYLIRPYYCVITIYPGGVWHAQPTLDIDPLRGTTVCEVTDMERGTSCGRSVAGTSRQRSCAVHPTDTAVAYVFTHG